MICYDFFTRLPLPCPRMTSLRALSVPGLQIRGRCTEDKSNGFNHNEQCITPLGIPLLQKRILSGTCKPNQTFISSFMLTLVHEYSCSDKTSRPSEHINILLSDYHSPSRRTTSTNPRNCDKVNIRYLISNLDADSSTSKH